MQRIELSGGTIDPDKPGGGTAKDPKTDTISQIIETMNELFAGELSDDDKLNYARTIKDKVVEDETVTKQLETNSKEQAMLGDFPDAVVNAIIESMGKRKCSIFMAT